MSDITQDEINKFVEKYGENKVPLSLRNAMREKINFLRSAEYYGGYYLFEKSPNKLERIDMTLNKEAKKAGFKNLHIYGLK